MVDLIRGLAKCVRLHFFMACGSIMQLGNLVVLLGFLIKYVLKDHFEKLVSGEGVKCKSCL